MPKAVLPHNEEYRRNALEGYDLLDTLPEGVYDDIVYLAAQIMNSPTALVSLVDTDRQWFKAKYGLDAPETPRDVAFCAHAILSPNEPLIVLDALKDERFSDNALVLSEPHLRFYCGIPLVNKEGYPLGTLCVLDYEPRESVSDEQIKAMKALARNVLMHIENRLSTQRASLLWEDSKEALWEYNVLDHSLFVSPAFKEMLGYQDDEIFNKIMDMFLVIHPDDVIMAKSLMQDYVKDPVGHYSCRVRLKNKQGEWRWCHIKGYAVQNMHNKAIKVSGTLVDITQDVEKDKSLVREEALRKSFIEASYDGYWDINVRSGKSLVSKRFLEILGYNPNEVTASDLNLKDVIAQKDVFKTLREYKIHVRSQGEVPFRTEISFNGADNKHVILLCRGRIIEWEEGIPKRMIGTATDITESRKLSEIQVKLNKELMETNEELGRFTYMASHDLQEPLRMIKSFTQLLEKKYFDQFDSKAQHYMHVIVSATERMQAMITDLLEYARADNRIDVEYISLDDIVKSALAQLENAIEQSSAQITCDVLPFAWGHKSYLISVFQNIIGNAIKYQPEGQTPEVNIICHETDTSIEVQIKDNGIGIKEEYRAKIFEPFKRLHTKAEYSGTGMGLAIARKIMEKMHGSIDIHSSPGQGSTFILTFSKEAQFDNFGYYDGDLDRHNIAHKSGKKSA